MTTANDPVYAAADLLFRARHQLPPDILRTLADTWSCASAVRYGEAHERFWELNDEVGFYRNHDTSVCEDEHPVTVAESA